MAASLLRLAHIAFHVPAGTGLVSDLVGKFRFQLFAARVTARARQLALRQGAAIFLVNERLGEAPGFPSHPAWPTPALPPLLSHATVGELLYDVAPSCAIGTASNVCFEVEDVPGLSRCLQERGCPLAIPPTDVTDDGGSVTYCVVRSVVGNVSHTLLDRSRYRGPFLPGFQAVGGVPERLPERAEITHFDHITYACSPGSTRAVLDWHERCFGFQRFLVNRQEDAAQGYRISGRGVGLQLAAMRNGQPGAAGPTGPSDDCKFILAEPLPEPGKNQVDAFLAQHGGAGIQHVALYTTDIVSTARALGEAGVRFFEPPRAYYSEAGKEEEIQHAGQDPRRLAQHGILLDSELAGEGEGDGAGTSLPPARYLMQLFTKPLFPEETFFLELIERRGASGFGEGNIRALWRSVQAYLDQHT